MCTYVRTGRVFLLALFKLDETLCYAKFLRVTETDIVSELLAYLRQGITNKYEPKLYPSRLSRSRGDYELCAPVLALKDGQINTGRP